MQKLYLTILLLKMKGKADQQTYANTKRFSKD